MTVTQTIRKPPEYLAARTHFSSKAETNEKPAFSYLNRERQASTVGMRDLAGHVW